jgi:hypothetical protein
MTVSFFVTLSRHCEPPLLLFGGEAISVSHKEIASGKKQERPRNDGG